MGFERLSEPLNDKNFRSWSSQMRAMLELKNAWEATRPLAVGEVSPAVEAADSRKALSYLVLNAGPHVQHVDCKHGERTRGVGVAERALQGED